MHNGRFWGRSCQYWPDGHVDKRHRCRKPIVSLSRRGLPGTSFQMRKTFTDDKARRRRRVPRSIWQKRKRMHPSQEIWKYEILHVSGGNRILNRHLTAPLIESEFRLLQSNENFLRFCERGAETATGENSVKNQLIGWCYVRIIIVPRGTLGYDPEWIYPPSGFWVDPDSCFVLDLLLLYWSLFPRVLL